MATTINTESRGARAIIGIAHAAGIAEMYLNTLDRIFNTVLYNQDDLGMSDTEAISTLQSLGLLRSDIQDIAADKDLARALGVARQTTDEAVDEIEIIQTGPFSAKIVGRYSTQREPWLEIANALKSAVVCLRARYCINNKCRDLTDLLDLLDDVTERLGNVKEWIDALAENPDFTDRAANAAIIRTFSHVACSKAVHNYEILNEIQGTMMREGYPDAKINEIGEAIKLQKQAAEILKRNLDDLTPSAAENQEGGKQ